LQLISTWIIEMEKIPLNFYLDLATHFDKSGLDSVGIKMRSSRRRDQCQGHVHRAQNQGRNYVETGRKIAFTPQFDFNIERAGFPPALFIQKISSSSPTTAKTSSPV